MSIKKAIQDKNGNPIIIEVESNEPEETVLWHFEKPIQLIISNEIKTNWLLKKQEHDIMGNYPDINAILEYVKSISTTSINEGGNLYIYLDELFEQHRLFLENFGVIINIQ